MNFFLIRTQDNELIGPYAEAQVREMIANKKIDYHTELQASAGYWFSINDTKEVAKHFGETFTRALNQSGENTVIISGPEKNLDFETSAFLKLILVLILTALFVLIFRIFQVSLIHNM